MAAISRIWRMAADPFLNEGGKVVVESHAGLPPEPAKAIAGRLGSGEFTVTIERVAADVEDLDRNVVTEPDGTYQVISDGVEYYQVQVD